MKYLYMIFRLFKCPHKFTHYAAVSGKYSFGEGSVYIEITKCNRCGKLHQERIS